MSIIPGPPAPVGPPATAGGPPQPGPQLAQQPVAAPVASGSIEDDPITAEHRKEFDRQLTAAFSAKANNQQMLSTVEYSRRIEHLLNWDALPLTDRNYNWANTFEVMQVGQDKLLVKRPKSGTQGAPSSEDRLIYTHAERLFDDLASLVDDDGHRASVVYKNGNAKFANISRECTQIFCKSFPSMKPGKAAALRAAQNGRVSAGAAGKIISRLPPVRKRKADDTADVAPPPPLNKKTSSHVQMPAIEVPVSPQVIENRIKDIGLAAQGNAKIKLAERNMYALVKLRERYALEKPFKDLRISINLHVTKETAVLVKTLLIGGANVAITGCNSFSTQDEIAASLAEVGCTVHAIHGCSNDEYRSFLDALVAFKPDLIIDDGGDLTVQAHKTATPSMLAKLIGACEQTTSGVLRMKNMTLAGSLKCPLITTNDNKTKHLLDNYYGTGQSCWDGIMRATSYFVAGKVAVCVGYGECGKGIALRAKGLGASVIITEVDAFAALRATYDGFAVMPIQTAAEKGDFFITATSNKHAIDLHAIRAMKDGAVLSNAGQFVNEIDVKGLRKLAKSTVTVRKNMEQITLPSGKCVFLLGGGNLLNLSCAEGHPSEVMTTSFLGQALACEYLVENSGKLAPGVTALPPALDNQIAAMQLDALGVNFDVMTAEQVAYMSSWEEGTD